MKIFTLSCSPVVYRQIYTGAVFGLFCGTVQGVGFEFGEAQGSWDTTLSYGMAWRISDQDADLIGIANGGNAFSVNSDDGNLNYDKGLISNVVKATSEIELNYRSWSAFVRGLAFYDFENENSSRERTPLSDEALELVGSDIELLDAYLSANFTLGERPGQIRLGEQVVSWGESTFIQNSINTINPVNVAAIRLPGAELREALLPEGMVWGSLGITENVNVEAFYLYDWDETEIDPPGSYFSTNDFVGDGGNKVLLGFGGVPDGGIAPPEETFFAVPRAATREAEDQGQFGVALRLFVPPLNDTEFGFYYVNYHSRLPLISARTGTQTGAARTLTAGTAAATLGATGNPAAAVTSGTRAGINAGLDPATAQAVATGGVQAAATGGAAAAQAFATDQYSQTARYFTEYPENIHLFGVSFNTTLPVSGVALQGEISHRRDVPLQVDDIEILFATLGPINDPLATLNQIGNFTGQFETDVTGFIRRHVSQAQLTATKLFGPTFGANQLVLVGEVGMTHVHDMPSKDELRLDAPGTFISGNTALAGIGDPQAGTCIVHSPTAPCQFEPADNFADATSWGYRLVGRLQFNNVIGAINLFPRLAWQHDVNGTTPGPGGPFVDGRKAITLGLGATYLGQWSADLSYTNFFGAGRFNLINDRDFIAFDIKYSF